MMPEMAAFLTLDGVTVGMPVAQHPPHRSGLEELSRRGKTLPLYQGGTGFYYQVPYGAVSVQHIGGCGHGPLGSVCNRKNLGYTVGPGNGAGRN